MGKLSVPLIYRQILKAAAKYPSVKRDVIIKEIKEEFHANKNLKERDRIEERYQAAVRGLEDLKQYVNMDKKSDEWDIYLRGSCP